MLPPMCLAFHYLQAHLDMYRAHRSFGYNRYRNLLLGVLYNIEVFSCGRSVTNSRRYPRRGTRQIMGRNSSTQWYNGWVTPQLQWFMQWLRSSVRGLFLRSKVQYLLTLTLARNGFVAVCSFPPLTRAGNQSSTLPPFSGPLLLLVCHC